jgi:DNA-binding CsgD family transcriptional regulator
MYLTIRQAQAADIPKAFGFVIRRFRVPAIDVPDLQKMWAQVLAEGETNFSVVEDTDRPADERIVSFILTYCVPESISEYAREEAPPFLWRWTLQRWRQKRPVWMERKEARRAQTEAPVSVIAHITADVFRYSNLDLSRITNMHSAAATKDLASQRVRYYITEVYDPMMLERFLGHGFRIASQYPGHQDDPAYLVLPKDQRPVLLCADLLRATWDKELRHTSVGRAAIVTPPRFAFSSPEQELLKIALSGLTDQAIAEKLGLSLIAIKKRWKGIYEKVTEHSPPPAGAQEANIGRRQVLQMMADHPEELRPNPHKNRSSV